MTQALPKPSKTSLYDRDLNLWLEAAIAQLKAGDFHNLDVENLVEELEGLAGRDRRELMTMQDGSEPLIELAWKSAKSSNSHLA